MRRICCLLLIASLGAVATGASAQAMPESTEEWYLPSADGCRLYVWERGSGPDTVVVLNGGFGQDHTYMLPGFSGIEDRYRVIFYDPRGSLRSPCPDSLITLQKHVDDLDRLRMALRASDINIAGHSAGSMLAMTYLQQHPRHVRALALLGALPARRVASAEGNTVTPGSNAGRDSMRNRPVVREELRKAGVPDDSARWTPQQRAHAARIRLAGMGMYRVDRWRQLRTFYSASAGAAAGRTVPRSYDFTPAIAAHRCRVWVLIGDHDYVDYGLPEHRRWTADVPNARLEVFRNAGHVPWLDEPDLFREKLLEALGKGAACRPPS